MRLARHFLELHGERYDLPGVKLGADAVRALEAHDFPGNVRELEHWIESALVLTGAGGTIHAAHFPTVRQVAAQVVEHGVRLPLDLTLEQASRRYVRAVLDDAAGNKAEAARRLGASRNTVLRAVKNDPA